MNTVFSGNQVGSRVALDITRDYSLGLLAALAPYNDPQGLIQAQIAYTGTQVDITAGAAADFSSQLIAIEKTATVKPDSTDSQVAAINYINAATEVNYLNSGRAADANSFYSNAHSVFKIASDASYSAYLAIESYQVYLNKVSTSVTVISLGDTAPNINTIDVTSLSSMSTIVSNVENVALNNVTLASNNIQNYITNTRTLLNNAIIKSRAVSTNLTLAAAFNTLVKAVSKSISDPLLYIAGKELLVTQHVPSVPLNNAMVIATNALACLTAFMNALNSGVQTSNSITNTVSTTGGFASTLDSSARVADINMYLSTAFEKHMINTASTIIKYGGKISYPSVYPINPVYVSDEYIQAADAANVISDAADTSAVNARNVSNALIALKTAFQNTPYPDSTIYPIAAKSAYTINNLLLVVNKVTSNSSAHAAVAITARASNMVLGDLKLITEEEASSIKAASDAVSVTNLLIHAASNEPTLASISFQTLKTYLWGINAAKARSEEVTNNLKDTAFLLTKTARNLVNPQKIAVQTYSANKFAIDMTNKLSRLNRASRNVPVDPPKPYSSYKAGIRAKTFIPVRPSLDELVQRHRLEPIRIDSIKSMPDTKIRVAREVQRIKDLSEHSFRQQ